MSALSLTFDLPSGYFHDGHELIKFIEECVPIVDDVLCGHFNRGDGRSGGHGEVHDLVIFVARLPGVELLLLLLFCEFLGHDQ